MEESPRYGLEQARSKLPHIVAEAHAGTTSIISRHGKPYAAVVPLQRLARLEQAANRPPRALLSLLQRNRRRYGGYIVHLGMVIMFVAFAGMAFKTEMEATLKPGDTATLKSPFGHTYTFTHLGVSQFEQLNRVVTQASVRRWSTRSW